MEFWSPNVTRIHFSCAGTCNHFHPYWSESNHSSRLGLTGLWLLCFHLHPALQFGFFSLCSNAFSALKNEGFLLSPVFFLSKPNFSSLKSMTYVKWACYRSISRAAISSCKVLVYYAVIVNVSGHHFFSREAEQVEILASGKSIFVLCGLLLLSLRDALHRWPKRGNTTIEKTNQNVILVFTAGGWWEKGFCQILWMEMYRHLSLLWWRAPAYTNFGPINVFKWARNWKILK